MVYRIPAILLIITVHEFAHGLAAYMLGDRAARTDGRMSLNPLKRMDWLGLICMLVFGFGWATTAVDPRRFKNPKVDMALVSAAGPIMNFILSFVTLLIYMLLGTFTDGSGITGWLTVFFARCALMSLGLGIFNMLPIPPLDGAMIFGALLPDRLYLQYISMGRIGMFVVLALLWLGMIDRILEPFMTVMLSGMQNLGFAILSPLLG